jgi:hypothetical protein
MALWLIIYNFGLNIKKERKKETLSVNLICDEYQSQNH